MIPFLFPFIIFFLLSISSTIFAKEETSTLSEERIYYLKRCHGSACPYTASWLANINLFRRAKWFTDITKMEVASFNIFDKASQKYQLSDPDAYYVHHMSMYEHFVHRKEGFEIAFNKSQIMSRKAYHGECDQLNISSNQEYLSIIPFFGGLPPNVTKDLKVHSLGQGNSLVDPLTKAYYAMATVCSTLKYFGKVIIGVTRLEDRQLMIKMVEEMKVDIKPYVKIVHFALHRPSFLPFTLIAWAQHYVKHYNCQSFYRSSTYHPGKALPEGDINLENIPKDSEAYEICHQDSFSYHVGSPFHVLYHWSMTNDTLNHTLNHHNRHQSASQPASTPITPTVPTPIKYIYFSECDQVVYFDSEQTLQAISQASNNTCLFSGRRKEKNPASNPEEYMNGLTIWRECGNPGYSLEWPTTKYVHKYE